MKQGVFVAMVVSLVWVFFQNMLMFVRPAENRFKSMLTGYILSLPFVFPVYRWLPVPGFVDAGRASTESPCLGLFHAYFFHLLLFFCYVECFYHIERSVSLRLLVELLKQGDAGAPLQEIQGRYSVEGMIERRLEVLRDRGFIELRNDSWHLRFKGELLARVTVTMSWLFQAKGQHERG